MKVKLIWVTTWSEGKPDLKMFSGCYISKYSYPKDLSIWNDADFLSWLFMKMIFISNHLNPFNSGTLCSYRRTNRRSFLCIYGLRKNKLTFVFLWHSCGPDVKSSLIIFFSFSVYECCVSAWMRASPAPVFHAYLFLGGAIWLVTFRRLWGILAHCILDLN